VRNFGALWVIGQPPGKSLEMALRSRELWDAAARTAGFPIERAGSLHAAYEPDEWEVLQEFDAAASPLGYRVRLVTPEQACELSPGLVRTGLHGGLLSSTEGCVDPRETVRRLLGWLQNQPNTSMHFSTLVREVVSGGVITSSGEHHAADRVIICSGTDIQSLFPQTYASVPIRQCKLQMMRTGPQPGAWRLGPVIAAGASLRHYQSFSHCPSLPRLRARFAAQYPDFDRWGIHVMASQNPDGELAIGDSHVYDDDIDPFNSEQIDEAILEYFDRFMAPPDRRILQKWTGTYAKSDISPAELIRAPLSNVRVVLPPGGTGMTLAFGIASRTFDTWEAANSHHAARTDVH
jgi:FAD dependent oxidoreductase TIGR03364